MDIQKQHEDFDLWWEGNAIAMMCEEDEALKIWQAAKAQAVTEGFVLVNKKDLVKVLNCVTDDWLIDTDSFEEFKKIESLVQDEVNAMIEAREPVKHIIIHWGMECPICNHNEATCYSTATQESGYEFMDGDAVVCLKCGNKGEMDADGENSDIAWDEAQEQSHESD